MSWVRARQRATLARATARSWRMLVAVIASSAALGLAAEASLASDVEATVAKKGKSRDFGDAPDGRPAGYDASRVKGRFPSRSSSTPPGSRANSSRRGGHT